MTAAGSRSLTVVMLYDWDLVDFTAVNGGFMSDELRFQRKCFFASSDYAESFCGKYIYIYQGKGSLRLKSNSLCLEGCPQALDIPFGAVNSVTMDRFSSWAKPLGLSRLTVNYLRDGKPTTIHLVPYESVFDSTEVTSNLVASWHETLRQVETLANRVQLSQLEPMTQRSPLLSGLALAGVLILPLVVSWLVWLA
jgi:hypothetical protein